MKSRSAAAALVVAVLVAAAAAVLPSSEAALSCSAVFQKLMPCLGYLRSSGTSGTPPALCCNGISTLMGEANDKADRQTACRCLKTAASGITGINFNLAGALPKRCGVVIPYKISPSTDCNKGRSPSRAPQRESDRAALSKPNTSPSNAPLPQESPPTLIFEIPTTYETSMEDPIQTISSNMAINDLNQSLILSPTLEDPPDLEENSSPSRVQRDFFLIETIGGSSTVWVITRSAAVSPSRLIHQKANEKIPKTPGKTIQEGDSSKASNNPSPTPHKGNKKKGKKPTSSSSQ